MTAGVVALVVLATTGPLAHSTGSRQLVFASPAVMAAVEAPSPPSQQSPTLRVGPRARPVKRKILFGLVGAAAGVFAGGLIGARIEGRSCACDDPGLQGWMIGAPIGGVVGGFVGAKLAR